jgi:hypothetical protein
MTFARRLSAATMALLLALFPMAMERCRTACIGPAAATAPAASSAHGCHDASSEGSGARIDPMARACGHSDEARTNESTGLAAGKPRTDQVVPALLPLPQQVHTAAPTVRIDRSLDRSSLAAPLGALNSPLRL